MIMRLHRNQTIKPSSDSNSSFTTPESMLQYLEKNSNYIKPVNVKYLAQGGEAIVYRIEHAGLDELVAKCSKNEEDFKDLYEET